MSFILLISVANNSKRLLNSSSKSEDKVAGSDNDWVLELVVNGTSLDSFANFSKFINLLSINAITCGNVNPGALMFCPGCC